MKYVTLGRTGERVSRIGMGGFPLGGVNRARGWDPYTPQGRKAAVDVVRYAIEKGINYIDTAEGYGGGHSESIIGEAIAGRREGLFIATKFNMNRDADGVTAAAIASIERLGCGYLDLLQVHGGYYTAEDTDRILNGGPMDALRRLRRDGKVRFIGATTEEPFSILPMMRTGLLDVVQVRYNLIYQAAAHHLLDEARRMGVGVVLMRPLTSGILQYLSEKLLPELSDGCDLYEACLKFVLADSRVHVANIGMRWPQEVDRNAALVDEYEPPFDVAGLPRGTGPVYDAMDSESPGPAR